MVSSHSPLEPDPLTRATYLPVVLTLISGSLYSTVRGRGGQVIGLVILASAPLIGMFVSPALGWAMIWLPLAVAVVIIPAVALWVPLWNALRPDRRAWVGADARSFATARLAPPNFYPDNASARRPGRQEAKGLLDRIFQWADQQEQTAYFTASSAKVAQVYIDRYDAEIIGTSWGRPKMRRRPHARPRVPRVPR